LKVAQLSHDGFLPKGVCGNAIVNYDYHQMLKRVTKDPADSILILFNKDEEDYQYEDIRIRVANAVPSNWTNQSLYNESIADDIADKLEEEKIDVVLFGDVDEFDDSTVYYHLLKRLPRSVKKIAVQHGYYGSTREFQRLFDGFFVFTEYQKDRCVSDGIPKDRVVVVPPPIDFRKIPKNRPLSERTPNSLLFIGRVMDVKGPHHIIPHLERAGVEKYTIAGPLHKDEPKYLDRIIKLAENYGVRDRLNILGEIEPNSILEFAQDYQMFIQPSRSEGFSLVLREALASGCISTARRNAVQMGYSWTKGHVYIGNSYQDMAGFLDYVINKANGPENQDRSDRAVQYMKDNFDIEMLSERVGMFLDTL
jgi:glycosyltransferase involved in cell wall biosynthesis